MSDEGELIIRICLRWDELGLPYALLGGYRNLPAVYTDVDVAVFESDFDAMSSAACDVADSVGYRLVQVVWYDVRRCIAFVFWRDGESVQLDLECDDWGLGHLGTARRDVLLARGTAGEKVARAAYLVRKRVHKGLLEPSHYSSLVEAVDFLIAESDDPKGRTLLSQVSQALETASGIAELNREFRRMSRRIQVREVVGDRVRGIRRAYWRLIRVAHRLLLPTGGVVDIRSDDIAEFGEAADRVASHYTGVFSREIRVSPESSKIRNLFAEVLAVRSKTLVLRKLPTTVAGRPYWSRADVSIEQNELPRLNLAEGSGYPIPTPAAKWWIRRNR